MYRNVVFLKRQRGAIRLGWVLTGSVLIAALGMTALASMRSERNLFAEAATKISKSVSSSSVVSTVRENAPGAKLRKCVINGKTVISNEDCKDSNPSSRDLDIRVTRGVEAPKVPPAPVPQQGSDPTVDKMIEKQVQ